SFLIKLTEYVKNKNLKININKIFYGGEYVTDEMIKFWKDVFGKNVLIKSGGYASADAGVIGFQCSYLEKGFHHLFNNSQYLEIVDSETLKPTKIGEVGEVLITPLGKRKMPLIRYRIGDLARWLDFKCKCGRNEPIFEIVGRCDDRIHAGGAHIFVWDIQKAISSIEGLSFNFQVIIDKKGAKDILEIIIESENWKESKNIIPKLEQKIFENCQDLFESIRMGWIDKPKISIVPPDTIERIKRTGKIKRVVDKRLKI
ncbi:MAG: GH3 auxin-responsive promoter family protein, partial [Elusimicrobiales bacterium]|nr:GH3 auxin-responsive promoter family protein [Elusimicrobiales bacterium]